MKIRCNGMGTQMFKVNQLYSLQFKQLWLWPLLLRSPSSQLWKSAKLYSDDFGQVGRTFFKWPNLKITLTFNFTKQGWIWHFYKTISTNKFNENHNLWSSGGGIQQVKNQNIYQLGHIYRPRVASIMAHQSPVCCNTVSPMCIFPLRMSEWQENLIFLRWKRETERVLSIALPKFQIHP